MSSKIKVIVIGLGEIGLEVCKLILQKKSLLLQAVVDIDPNKTGKDLGEFLYTKKKIKKLGIPVEIDLQKVIRELQPEVAIITTKSKLPEIANDIFTCIENHISVISSCEELVYPFVSYPELSNELDKKAKENFVQVLGTGVNPGFIMDSLPLFLTSVCFNVKSIEIERIVDLKKRRKALQIKAGLGLSPKEFNKLVKNKVIGHVGLIESGYFISDYLKLKISNFKESIKPIIAKSETKTKYFTISKGKVSGFIHNCEGLYGNKKVISLKLIFNSESSENFDSIIIKGEPNIHIRIENGIHGDIATVAMMVNCIPNLLHSRFGLITMKELSLPSIINPSK